MQDHVSNSTDVSTPNSFETPLTDFDYEVPDHLHQFVEPQGLVRDARVIESRVRALYINRDNVKTLLDGFENPTTTIRFV